MLLLQQNVIYCFETINTDFKNTYGLFYGKTLLSKSKKFKPKCFILIFIVQLSPLKIYVGFAFFMLNLFSKDIGDNYFLKVFGFNNIVMETGL